MGHSITIPARNEEDPLAGTHEADLPSLDVHGDPFQVFVAVDRVRDRTHADAAKFVDRYKRVLCFPTKLGNRVSDSPRPSECALRMCWLPRPGRPVLPRDDVRPRGGLTGSRLGYRPSMDPRRLGCRSGAALQPRRQPGVELPNTLVPLPAAQGHPLRREVFPPLGHLAHPWPGCLRTVRSMSASSVTYGVRATRSGRSPSVGPTAPCPDGNRARDLYGVRPHEWGAPRELPCWNAEYPTPDCGVPESATVTNRALNPVVLSLQRFSIHSAW